MIIRKKKDIFNYEFWQHGKWVARKASDITDKHLVNLLPR